MSFNIISLLISITLGLLGIGQLHDYIVTGNVPKDFDKAPQILRGIVEYQDRMNAKRIADCVAYADASGEDVIWVGNVRRTVDIITGKWKDPWATESNMKIRLQGLTDSQIKRAERFLTFDKEGMMVCSNTPLAVK